MNWSALSTVLPSWLKADQPDTYDQWKRWFAEGDKQAIQRIKETKK